MTPTTIIPEIIVQTETVTPIFFADVNFWFGIALGFAAVITGHFLKWWTFTVGRKKD